MMNLAETIKQSCSQHPHKRLIFDDEVLTYDHLWNTASKIRHALEDLGVKAGDRVAIQLPKCLEFLYIHLANLQLGSISVPLNPTYTRDEIAYFLGDSRAKIFVTDGHHAGFADPESTAFPELQKVINIDLQDSSTASILSFNALLQTQALDKSYPAQRDDIALIIYTSGTTGRSKGAMLSHQNILTNLEALHKLWNHSDQDILLHVLPIFHVHGLLVAFHGALNAGMDIIMRTKFDPIDTLNCIQKNRCSIFMGVPTMYHRLLQVDNPQKFDFSSMRLWISGSAPLLTSTFEQFQQVFGHTVLERYGMSETGMNVSNPLYGVRKPGSVGLPVPGVSVRIVDSKGQDVIPGEVGEVWVKGNNVFKGYWEMPEKTAESFVQEWFKTGDLGYHDTDGYLFLVGRSKDLIISGGMNVYPKEIEALIETLEEIEEAAVIGVPDEDLGEKVIAVVVPKPGRQVNVNAITTLCQNHLAGYKRPKAIYLIDKLPRNTMGKVTKNQLRDKYRIIAQ